MNFDDDQLFYFSLFFAGDVCAVAELGAQGRVLRGEVQLPHPVHAQRPLPHSLQGRTTQLGHSRSTDMSKKSKDGLRDPAL